MKDSFWHQKWQDNEIPFHERQANILLQENFKKLALAKGSRVFLPLCGKTRDISWLMDQGMNVVGAELSELAINALFKDLGLQPIISQQGDLKHYQAKNIDMYVGDIFTLSENMLGTIHAVYDRAALVALPDTMRNQYSAHLINITSAAPQLLITFEYDQSIMPGPPFSISAVEVKHHYEGCYKLNCLEEKEVEGGLKGKVSATENAWLLNH